MRVVFVSLAIILTSCSHMSENTSRRGEIHLKGGYYGSSAWEDKITFKHVSWYKGLTLTFDVLHSKVESHSPFYAWFSDKEKMVLSGCRDHLVVLLYQKDNDIIPISTFLLQAKKSGYDQVHIKEFSRHLKMHPNVSFLSVNMYKVYGLCRNRSPAPGAEDIRLRFPGFKEVILQ